MVIPLLSSSGGEVNARLRTPVFVMIRPRGGDFLYSDVEYAVMLRKVAHARALTIPSSTSLTGAHPGHRAAAGRFLVQPLR
jgi:copper homeostasis protein CutC